MKLRENNLRVTHYEIHAINSNKAIGQYIFYWIVNHMESIECQSLCRAEVT